MTFKRRRYLARSTWRLLAALAVLTAAAGTASAQQVPALAADQAFKDSIGTLVYDARVREFVCWSEGTLQPDFRAHLCDPQAGWHPLTANLYFVRGQSITVVIQHGMAEDIFSLDVKADDLAEPQVPVSGALTVLPKLQSIPAAPTVLAGVGASFVAGETPIHATSVFRMAIVSEEKDFKAWLQTNLIDPLSSKEVTDLLAIDIDTAIAQAAASKPFVTEITAIRDAVDAIGPPVSLQAWVTGVRALVDQIDAEAAARARLVVTGITAAGATINSALAAARATPVQKALAIDRGDLAALANTLAVAFAQDAYARIDRIRVVNKKFATGDGDMQDVVAGLNAALGATDATSVLARAKANLADIADIAPQVQLADTRRQQLQNLKTKLDAQRDSLTGVFALQKAWTATVAATIAKAALLNAAAKDLPLDSHYDVIPVGQWFTSKTVTLTVKQGQRVALFDIAGVTDATRAGIAGGDTPTSKGTQIAAVDLAAARVLQFPIYNLYRFKIGMGFLYSTAPDKVYSVDKVTTGSGAAAVTQQFIDQTRDRDYNILTSVNLLVFPWTRHAFPWRPRYAGEASPPFYHDLAAMIGFSVTSPARDFLVGGAWFPRMSPVGVQVGWHLSLRDYPPPNTDLTMPLAGRVILLKQTRVDGIAAGLIFSTDFFNNVFAAIFKP